MPTAANIRKEMKLICPIMLKGDLDELGEGVA
jgi:hypothetical protein